MDRLRFMKNEGEKRYMLMEVKKNHYSKNGLWWRLEGRHKKKKKNRDGQTLTTIADLE